MSKQILNQRYVYKIKSDYLQRNKWNIKITNIEKAIKDRYIVGIGDSTGLRKIRDVIDSPYTEDYINNIKDKIKKMERQDYSKMEDSEKKAFKKEYKQLKYEEKVAELESCICNVVFKSKKHFDRAVEKGFKINGEKYVLLLGTTGGIKNNTAMFIREDIHEDIWEIMQCGADDSLPMIPSKKMGYLALFFSGSTPVTDTKKVLVVKDIETHFKAPATYIKFNEEKNRPDVTFISDYDVEVNACDGCGMIDPKLAEQWAKDLQIDYVPTAFCTRKMWEKGILTTFDFKKYCKEVIKQEIVKDVWGVEHNINDIDIILNESMLKLSKAYASIDSYNGYCEKYGVGFAVTKYSPKVLENQRALNYQYIQCLDLSDDDIEELLRKDINEVKDVLGLDYRKTILFGKGTELTDKNVWRNEYNKDDAHIRALMIDKDAINDEYVKYRVRRAISKRIDLLKTGKIKVDANYQIAIGEPIIQLESMFGLEPKGLLNAGEFYIEYWRQKGETSVGVFRSPMSVKSNTRTVEVCNREEVIKWYGDLNNVIIFNAWDTCMSAFNGEDFDGDMNFTTSNEIIKRGICNLPAIFCEGKQASKKPFITKEDYAFAIVNSFGNAVGGVTNFGSSCYDKMALFEEGCTEYNEIYYRIQCTQYYQQECIDSAKNGEPPKPIPNYWHMYNAEELKYKVDEETGEVLDSEEEIKEKDILNAVLTEKKPYYFIYIYDTLKKEYNSFIKGVDNTCMELFNCRIKDLKAKEKEYLTEEEKSFLRSYEIKNPISSNPCIVNKMAWLVEREFNKQVTVKNKEFDWFIYQNPNCLEIGSKSEMTAIKKAYDEYKIDIKNSASVEYDKEKGDSEATRKKNEIEDTLLNIIPNKQVLLNSLLELGYKKSKISKTFIWNVVGDQIIENMINNKEGKIVYPTKDENGEINYGGNRFTMVEKVINIEGDVE